MFEYSLALLINNEIIKLAKKFNWKSVKCIMLKMGMMNALNPKLIENAFSQVAKGGVNENAQLLIMITPFKLRCKNCKQYIYSEEKLNLCPNCGAFELEIQAGREFCIELLEVEN
ncbi:MAG: hydrogenase maturation nickel metallochaperone HypA [Synergistaceae bacterium]|nr:hydrogenase maturation nickel metallochaperone HypA [Synergistaceae bacterium]MBQ6740639.1 hydrogenase maturation nickel metallochaperone HypA [Synergistaceae bacterium]MBQ6909257.1 hydrogenase maturation nickel metallochaperone HypA [Synergistaceae bacterium]MBR0043478.1 hydrogenase maturation nickel metallochaperone HypA [Synergistaceae bacterium]MBR0097944.1 hydrogenase maturation nickel metallochaperone HypA [Synergistaceae bacterium]